MRKYNKMKKIKNFLHKYQSNNFKLVKFMILYMTKQMIL